MKPKQADSRSIWLDKLPRDVCTRIILYLHPPSLLHLTKQSCCLLYLAEASDAMRIAVSSAHSHTLSVPKQADKTLWSRWAAVFVDNLSELTLLTHIEPSEALLRARTLQRVSLMNIPAVLRSLQHTHHLRHLQLYFVRHSNASSQQVLTALRQLALESLSLSCDVHSVMKCFFRGKGNMEFMAASLSSLQSLRVVCFCNHGRHPLWVLLPLFPRLQQVSLDHQCVRSLPEGLIPRLQELEAVALRGGNITVETALRIGTPVKSYQSSLPLDKSNLLAIDSCLGILELQICLKREAWGVLSDLTKALPRLETLHLRAFPAERAFQVTHDSVLRAVQNAPYMRNLRLIGLRVETHELVETLRHLGERLLEFETTVDEMDPSQIGQIEALLQTAVTCNSSLRKFDVISTIVVGKRPCHWPSVSRRVSKIRLLYERLRLRAAGLYSWSLEKYIDLLEHDALHEAM